MKKIEPHILSILDGVQVEGNTVRIVQQLDRPTYVNVNKVLESIGGKWDRKAKGHVFEAEPGEVLEQVMLTGEYTNKKQDFGFFETPYVLAEQVIELAQIHTSHRVLEPSAGRGALLAPLGDPAQLAARIELDTVEIQPENTAVLTAKGYRCRQGDFLKMKGLGEYDVIVMNPPFAKQTDIDHVECALGYLKKGGRLVAIMSAGVKFRDNKKTNNFRIVVDAYGGEIIDNPDGAFKTSGTMVNTVTVVFET